ncbi:hypothetical protein B0H10DRAFT_1826379 [Mycena sp. CBHHK59/15]|nr:hypothetical protein B0H10DRAFT_1826379 [Mycena sp. CBHHK59/15]
MHGWPGRQQKHLEKEVIIDKQDKPSWAQKQTATEKRPSSEWSSSQRGWCGGQFYSGIDGG